MRAKSRLRGGSIAPGRIWKKAPKPYVRKKTPIGVRIEPKDTCGGGEDMDSSDVLLGQNAPALPRTVMEACSWECMRDQHCSGHVGHEDLRPTFSILNPSASTYSAPAPLDDALHAKLCRCCLVLLLLSKREKSQGAVFTSKDRDGVIAHHR